MALIEITVDNPSLINTGEDETNRETTDDDSSMGFSSDREDGDSDTGLIGTVGTFVTALSALAGVLRKLRSEEEAEDAGGVLESIGEDADDDSLLGSVDETVDEIDEAEGEDADEEESSGSGLGTKVAVLLVIVLVVAVLLSRGDDEEAEFEEAEFEEFDA